ncbi:hypothetical protein ACLKA6_006341 [Drosophila palustris]
MLKEVLTDQSEEHEECGLKGNQSVVVAREAVTARGQRAGAAFSCERLFKDIAQILETRPGKQGLRNNCSSSSSSSNNDNATATTTQIL